MYRKNIIVSLLAAVMILAGSFAAYAQTAPVRGKVELKKADGTTVPVADAVVEAYRTDVSRGKMPPSKTDKKGFFNFAGFPLGQTFVIVVSAPGIRTEYFPNVRAGAENIVITAFEGDGKKPTEEEVRQALANVSTQPQQSRELTAEQKKQQAEFEKQRAEIEAKNKKIESSTAIIKASLDEGGKAFEAKNYDLAIAKFEEGYNADPEFAGTAPVLLNNKSLALLRRAIDKYNQIPKDATPTARLEALAPVKKDLMDVVDAATKSLTILGTATSTDANVQKGYDANKAGAYANRVEAYRLLFRTKADVSVGADAVKALQEYEAVETDAAKKAKVQLGLADAIREAGDMEGHSIAIYRRVLEAAPENTDALAGLGLSLFNAGVMAQNKEQMQEGLNIMQRFADTAPDTHPLKVSVREAVDYLKTQEKLTPQKTTRPAATKKRT
jgi:tetratricopeptide (TPR) repeat protein